MKTVGALDLAAFFEHFKLILLYIVIPALIGFVIFRKIAKAIFKLIVLGIVIVGAIVYFYIGF